MNAAQLAALILALVGPLLTLAHALRLPPTLALFAVGFGSAYLPGLPEARVDPQLLLDLLLPPIVYAAAVRVSYHLLRFTLVPGVLLGAVLTPATMAAVAFAARALLPGLSWTAALLLGVILSVFDTRLFHEAESRPHVPRAVADTLTAREMVARAVALSVFAILQAAATEGPLAPAAAVGNLALALTVGVAVGVLVGRVIVLLRERAGAAPGEVAVTLAAPYLAALAADALAGSVVVAVMAAALTIAAGRVDPRTGTPTSSSEARLVTMAFWEGTSLVLGGVLFLLAGRALPQAMAALGTWSVGWLAFVAAALLAVVLAIQYAFALPATLAPRLGAALRRRERGSDSAPTTAGMTAAGVMTWGSTRSVVGLVVALAVPTTVPGGAAFAERDLVLVLAALAIVGSVILQGLTLRAVVRATRLADAGEDEERRTARGAAVAAAAAGGFDAGRRALLALRASNRIGDELLRAMLREIDLHERATQGDVLPGAEPPYREAPKP